MSSTLPPARHTPVLLKECIDALEVKPGGRYIDCTVGEGGHAMAILEACSPGGALLGIDADPEAIKIANQRLSSYAGALVLVQGNFSHLQEIGPEHDFQSVHGILFDLGISSLQLESRGRGFSFQRDDPLDMRFDPEQNLTASHIVNTFSEIELTRLLKAYSEEPRSRAIAHRIVASRPIESTLQLSQIVEGALKGMRRRIHPATRVFQALRIAVNRELDNLESALAQAIKLLRLGGKLVVISYHSLEDRIVKGFVRRESRDCICPPGTPQCICGHRATLRPLTKKPITPSISELNANPRSRSAKMRAAEQIGLS